MKEEDKKISKSCLLFFLLEFGIVFEIFFFLQSMLEGTFWSFEGF